MYIVYSHVPLKAKVDIKHPLRGQKRVKPLGADYVYQHCGCMLNTQVTHLLTALCIWKLILCGQR